MILFLKSNELENPKYNIISRDNTENPLVNTTTEANQPIICPIFECYKNP